MTTTSVPPPYTSTTAAHLTRFAAIWVTALGLLLLLLSSGQLFVWDDPGALLLALAMVGGGGLTWLACRVRLDTLHRANRDYLLSEYGIQAMAGREAFASLARQWMTRTLVVFMVAGAVVIFTGSSVACHSVPDVQCRIPEVHPWLFYVARLIAGVAGAAFVGVQSLRRSHQLETERMDAVIAEGQRRRQDGPTPGIARSRWE
jgi:4-amino-4-deoxy-L-arabinose transferase-like glycosyltransferase